MKKTMLLVVLLGAFIFGLVGNTSAQTATFPPQYLPPSQTQVSYIGAALQVDVWEWVNGFYVPVQNNNFIAVVHFLDANYNQIADFTFDVVDGKLDELFCLQDFGGTIPHIAIEIIELYGGRSNVEVFNNVKPGDIMNYSVYF